MLKEIMLHASNGANSTFGCSRPILDELLRTSTCNLSLMGGASNININSSSHLGSLFFFTCCTNKITKKKKMSVIGNTNNWQETMLVWCLYFFILFPWCTKLICCYLAVCYNCNRLCLLLWMNKKFDLSKTDKIGRASCRERVCT